MKPFLKPLAGAVLITAGVLATAAVAQDARTAQRPTAAAPQSQPMMSGQPGGMMGMMHMMNDPAMTAQMNRMMENCSRMMERMDGAPANALSERAAPPASAPRR